jgi:hypothetical protein
MFFKMLNGKQSVTCRLTIILAKQSIKRAKRMIKQKQHTTV